MASLALHSDHPVKRCTYGFCAALVLVSCHIAALDMHDRTSSIPVPPRSLSEWMRGELPLFLPGLSVSTLP